MLTGVEGFEPPSWEALLDGARPPPHPEDHEPGGTRGGWQHEPASRVERNFRDWRLMLVMSRAATKVCREAGALVTTKQGAAGSKSWRMVFPCLAHNWQWMSHLSLHCTVTDHQWLEQTPQMAQFWLRHVEERKGPSLSLWVLAGEVGGGGRKK